MAELLNWTEFSCVPLTKPQSCTNIGYCISILLSYGCIWPWLQFHYPVPSLTEVKVFFPFLLFIILCLNHSSFIRLLTFRYPYHQLPISNSSRFCVWSSLGIQTRSLSFPSSCPACSKAFRTFSDAQTLTFLAATTSLDAILPQRAQKHTRLILPLHDGSLFLCHYCCLLFFLPHHKLRAPIKVLSSIICYFLSAYSPSEPSAVPIVTTIITKQLTPQVSISLEL